MKSTLNERMGLLKYGVEHALSLYATSYFALPAEAIYDENVLKHYQSVIDSCHIYIIGYLPIIENVDIRLENDTLTTTVKVLEDQFDIKFELPSGMSLKENEGAFYVENCEGEKFYPSDLHIAQLINKKFKTQKFIVKYIGQAYGKHGSRNAIHRLKKHETLQKIALKPVPKGHKLHLLLLEVQIDSQLLSVFNGFVKTDQKQDKERISNGLDVINDTSEKQRISLFEAAFIKYFAPEYNKEFKNSFPSTNLAILQECYDKDLASVVCEINFDDLHFQLCSEIVESNWKHITFHNLHTEDERKAFFYLDTKY